MKRILLFSIIAIVILSACTNNNASNVSLSPSPQTTTTNTVQATTDADTSNEPEEQDAPLSNEQEALQFLEQAKTVASELESVSFYTSLFRTDYFPDLENESENVFVEYNMNIEGYLNRDPLQGYIYHSTNSANGTLLDGEKSTYEEETSITDAVAHYFDRDLGWYTEFIQSSYGGVVQENQSLDIMYDTIDSDLLVFDQIESYFDLFLSYPDQLKYEAIKFVEEGPIEHLVTLSITDEQIVEHLFLLDISFFTGYYNSLPEEDFFGIDKPIIKNPHIQFSFDENHVLQQLVVFYDHYGFENQDQVDKNWYTDHSLYISFSDHNMPYTRTIPEEVIINAVPYLDFE